jgi:hypothetical protein
LSPGSSAVLTRRLSIAVITALASPSPMALAGFSTMPAIDELLAFASLVAVVEGGAALLES